MDINEARRWAGQCWTTPENATKEMDSVLAESFATTLRDRVNEALIVQDIRRARQTMADAFAADPGFRLSYQANVACVLMDRVAELQSDYDRRMAIAHEIIKLVFES